MYALIRSSTLRELLAAEAPSLIVALVIAELFYKFGSFTWECLAFLPTWLAVSALMRLLLPRRWLTSKAGG